MNTVRCVFTEINTLLLATMGVGCDVQAKRPQVLPLPADQAPAFQTTVTPIAAQEIDLPVKEGPMPLAYIVESPGVVRVLDMTTRKSLAQTNAAGQSIVSIEQEHGVSIGGVVFSAGPLPVGHRFGVFLDTGGASAEDEIRTSTERNDPAIAHKHNQAGGSTTGPSPHQ